MDNQELIVQKDKELREELDLYKQMVHKLQKQMDEGKGEVSRDEINRAMKMLHDPFDVQDPFAINGDLPPDETDPDGQALRWLAPEYRARRGYRGWKLIQWGDQYGSEEVLSKYLNEPPARMIGPDKSDSYVRRGDLVLGRLNKRIWQSRQLKRELQSALERGVLGDGQDQYVREGLRIVGKGLERDKGQNAYSGQPTEFDKESAVDGVHRTELLGEVGDSDG